MVLNCPCSQFDGLEQKVGLTKDLQSVGARCRRSEWMVPLMLREGLCHNNTAQIIELPQSNAFVK